MNKIFAKSNGTTLSDHSELVAKVAVAIMVKSGVNDPELIETTRLAGLLHDIGKCTSQFQKKLGKIEDDNIESRLKFRHNEVGWAFLSKYLSFNRNINPFILDAVYWHHGITNNMCEFMDTQILDKVLKSDIDKMLDFLRRNVDESNIKTSPSLPRKTPTFYSTGDDAREINMKNTLIRACIISADRIVSKVDKLTLTDSEISDLISPVKLAQPLDTRYHKYYGNERFVIQESIVEQIGKTTIIKAPAGFGKTILGILWMISKGERICWVCPRNIIAESVFETIKEELDSFGFSHISLELYLSGEVVKNTHPTDGFNSDIIITNIDNYLAPSVDSRNADKLHQILNVNTIFDEWDELVTDSALFACFINLMNVRNNLTNANSLLLSATPLPIAHLWDTIDNHTTTLPSNTLHYAAAHPYPFRLNIVNDFSNVKDNNNTLVLMNSIRNSQINKPNNSFLFHSSFTNTDRKVITQKLHELYGKKKERTLGAENLIATLVVQASLDISFYHVFESVMSHQATFQRLGRHNRFGDYFMFDEPTFNICNLNDKSENKVRDIFFSKNLSNLWFEHISKYGGKLMTLDQAYNIYNKFTITHQNTLTDFVSQKYITSLMSLSNIHPIKFYTTKSKTGVLTAGGNKLRGSTNDIFVTAKIFGTNTYCDPFSVQIYSSISEQFDEHNMEVNLGNMLSTMKSIRNSNDDRFDYNDLLNDGKTNIDDIRKAAKKINTPYIRYDSVYHPTYGIIKISDLYLIK